jgi:hypothetical protein
MHFFLAFSGWVSRAADGVLKQQRGIRQFRTRGQQNVSNEFNLASPHMNAATQPENPNPMTPVNKANGDLTQAL